MTLTDQLDRVIAKIEQDEAAQLAPETLARWRADPYRWANERLKLPLKRWTEYAPATYATHKWDGSPDPLSLIHPALNLNKSVAVFSATGAGKTFHGGVLAYWFLDCWPGGQVITLAPKKEQLELHIWKEIGQLFPRWRKIHPRSLLGSLRLKVRPPSRHDSDEDDSQLGWGAVGFPCGVSADEAIAGRARGFHNQDMLFIVEEGNAVHASILAAIEFTCTAPHNLRVFFGNPDSDQDSLSQAAKSPNVVSIRASALDHPNIVLDDPSIIPGACSKPKIDEWREKYGEESPFYQSRARGIPPPQASDSLIMRAWVSAAIARGKNAEWVIKHQTGIPACGLDVAASESGDEGAYALGRGKHCYEIKAFACPDPGAFARDRIFPLVESGLIRDSKRVGCDAVGVGVAAISEMKRLGKPITPLIGGIWEKYVKDGDQLKNLRSQMWWQARLDLFHGLISCPDDKELEDDLCAPTWWTQNSFKIVESKEDFKVRLGRSPNKGDAYVYWNWIRQAQNYVDLSRDLTKVSP